MANIKILNEKKNIVNTISDNLKNATSFIIIDFKGINVQNNTKLRQELKTINSEYKVFKNTILRFAMKKIGYENLVKYLSNTTALIWTNSDETLLPAKIISKYISEINGTFNIKAGVIDGQILDSESIITIAKLPSKDILISQIAYLLLSPIIKLAVTTKSIINQKGE